MGAPGPGYGTISGYGTRGDYGNAAGYGTAPGYGNGDYGSAPAPSAPLGADVPRGASVAADLDVDMLSRPQLEFKGPGALAVCLFAGFGLFMIVGSAFALQNDGSFWGVPAAAGRSPGRPSAARQIEVREPDLCPRYAARIIKKTTDRKSVV